MNLNHHFYHFQELTIHDLHDFEMFSCNILKISWQRPGNFSRNVKSKMFIFQQAYVGFKIAIHSVIEAVQSLLQHDVSYVLTEVFCFSFRMKFHISWRNVFAKTHWRTIFAINAHLKQGKIIHLYGISNLVIMLSEIRKYFDQ